MLRTVLQVVATTPVQWEVRESAIDYLTNFYWRDQVHGLTYQRKLRALRRIHNWRERSMDEDMSGCLLFARCSYCNGVT